MQAAFSNPFPLLELLSKQDLRTVPEPFATSISRKKKTTKKKGEGESKLGKKWLVASENNFAAFDRLLPFLAFFTTEATSSALY